MKSVVFVLLGIGLLYGYAIYRESHMRTFIPRIDTVQQHLSLDEKQLVSDFLLQSDPSFYVHESPVLGGSWHITTVEVDTSTRTARLTIEDGHIQIQGTLKYEFDQTSGEVTVKSFTRQ